LDKSAGICRACHHSLQPEVRLSVKSRAQIVREDGRRNLTMVTPIYNEPACQTACHAHPASVKVLGVLDLALSLDAVDEQVAGMQYRVAGTTMVEILLLGVFIFFFTRRFVSRPIGELVAATHTVSATSLDEPIRVNAGSEEIDELARSFDDMRERLRLAVGEINQLAQGLEEKVEERTQQLRAAHHKLLQADRLASLGQLAASVAHEINNPIAGVLNLSMLMQRILKDDGVPPERLADFRKYLGQVVGETSRVGRIVSDLLAFSRRSKPQRSQADLNKIVQTTLSLVSHKLKLANVDVDLDLALDLPLAPCDASQMQQVVLNLVMNAAEATQVHGRGRLGIKTSADGGRVFLSVTDDGEGIPKENLSKIFDPFFTTKPEGKGVGLGLAVLYGIVSSHGGDVEVASQCGAGTVFTVSLPLAHAAGAAA
jgi:two-component system NtrC family sensor kinase